MASKGFLWAYSSYSKLCPLTLISVQAWLCYFDIHKTNAFCFLFLYAAAETGYYIVLKALNFQRMSCKEINLFKTFGRHQYVRKAQGHWSRHTQWVPLATQKDWTAGLCESFVFQAQDSKLCSFQSFLCFLFTMAQQFFWFALSLSLKKNNNKTLCQ